MTRINGQALHGEGKRFPVSLPHLIVLLSLVLLPGPCPFVRANPEIMDEIKRCVMDCGRELGNYLARRKAPTPYIDLTPHELSLNKPKAVINGLLLNSPDMIVLVRKNIGDEAFFEQLNRSAGGAGDGFRVSVGCPSRSCRSQGGSAGSAAWR